MRRQRETHTPCCCLCVDCCNLKRTIAIWMLCTASKHIVPNHRKRGWLSLSMWKQQWASALFPLPFSFNPNQNTYIGTDAHILTPEPEAVHGSEDHHLYDNSRRRLLYLHLPCGFPWGSWFNIMGGGKEHAPEFPSREIQYPISSAHGFFLLKDE